MKNLLAASLVTSFTFAALAQANPFSMFAGQYDSQSCKCEGVGLEQFSYAPCNLQGIEIRPNKMSDGATFWVLDEIFATKYTVRPLDEAAMKLLTGPGEVVMTDVRGSASGAEAIFTSNNGGVSNYKITHSARGLLYGGGFKGTENGFPVDVQCEHLIVKKPSP